MRKLILVTVLFSLTSAFAYTESELFAMPKESLVKLIMTLDASNNHPTPNHKYPVVVMCTPEGKMLNVENGNIIFNFDFHSNCISEIDEVEHYNTFCTRNGELIDAHTGKIIHNFKSSNRCERNQISMKNNGVVCTVNGEMLNHAGTMLYDYKFETACENAI